MTLQTNIGEYAIRQGDEPERISLEIDGLDISINRTNEGLILDVFKSEGDVLREVCIANEEWLG